MPLLYNMDVVEYSEYGLKCNFWDVNTQNIKTKILKRITKTKQQQQQQNEMKWIK